MTVSPVMRPLMIDYDYTGDPDGDLVDHEDEIIPGEGPNDDIIEAGAGDDVVIAGLGNDEVFGGDGDDDLNGNEGDDILYGEDGDDTLDGGDGNDDLRGGDGDDEIIGGDGNDIVHGGDGDDIIDTSGPDPLPDLGYPGLYDPDADPNNDRDTVSGGAGDDTITTGDDVDVIDGGTGDDTIDAGYDDDVIDGGDGDDTIIGNEGNDTIDGGAGDDTIYAGVDPSVPDGVNIPDDGSGPFGPDLVPGNGMDVVHGGDGDDTIYGGDDDDTLYGDDGDDVIYGEIDDDTLEGGAGNDTLSGGQGEDTMTGGDDRDLFIDITAGDVIDGSEGGDDYDTLDLTGAAPDGGSLNVTYDPLNPENGHVDFRDADGNITGTMEFVNIENVVPCFVAGTRIKTTMGEIAVEDLEVGQMVQTMDHGLQPIRWIGSAKRPAMGDLAPIRIRKGTLGNERDLWVSPQHRMLLSGAQTEMMFGESEVLATAKSLLNDHSITRVEGGEVEYFHILFDSHEIVYAEGAPSESFHPGEQGWKAMDQATRDEILELFPELASGDFSDYGPSARLSLKAHEAAVLKVK
ncbi:MAG: type I secretion protein [Rhodobacterales bacterium]|nr:MAG: type I secretion protein [Rhodobacterales bacterium]